MGEIIEVPKTFEFEYEYINGIYYHIIVNPYFDRDYYVAKKLGIDLAEYKKMMVRQLKAEIHFGDVVFRDQKKLKKALRYLDDLFISIKVAKKLTESQQEENEC